MLIFTIYLFCLCLSLFYVYILLIRGETWVCYFFQIGSSEIKMFICYVFLQKGTIFFEKRLWSFHLAIFRKCPAFNHEIIILSQTANSNCSRLIVDTELTKVGLLILSLKNELFYVIELAIIIVKWKILDILFECFKSKFPNF